MGYRFQQVAHSLEVLQSAGLLLRRQTAAHAARLYVFDPGGSVAGWVPELLALASTREGRLALRLALAGRPSESEAAPETRAG